MSYPAVRRWLMEHTSLEPSLLEGAGFDALVAERVAAVDGASESAYIAALDQSEDEVDRLTAGIAVPETWFFRYPQSFRLLLEFLERRRSVGAFSLRMLSIGCATGEEPYSMAMSARNADWPDDAITIEALDRNRAVLARAKSGEYGAASIRTEIPDWAAEFLRRSGSTVVVDPAIRGLVQFSLADVTRPGAILSGPPRDVIFCRNLLIYLGEEARTRLLDSICEALAPGGLLFLGHAEPLLCATPALRLFPAPHAFALERTGNEPGPLVRSPVVPPLRGRALESRIARPAPLRPLPSAPHSPAAAELTVDDARDLADAGRAQESEAIVRSILARQGPSAEALELLGMIRMASNDVPEARRCFEQAVYLEPSRTASLLQLAIISEGKGDARRAEALWNRARRSSAAGRKEPRQ